MTVDISGFGLQINILATETFPAGLLITQFADDADPFDLPSIQIADKAMGANGDLIVWSKANPINVTLNVIPQSDDDINLGILFEANRPSRGKFNIRDIITMSAIYPNGTILTLTKGKITDGMPGYSLASAGRLKTKAYAFSFENETNT